MFYVQEETSSNEHNAQIRSKLPTFHNPLKRFMKSKSEREADSEENVNRCEIRDLEKIDEFANLDSGKLPHLMSTKKKYIYNFLNFLLKGYIFKSIFEHILLYIFSHRQRPR